MGHSWILTFTLMLGEKDSGPDRQDSPWSPDAVLMDTVARLQRDLDDKRTESRYLRTSGVRDSLRQPRQVTFTSTKVPKFAGVTSWDQYRQVFDAIVRSNGWDDATAALQLLSHLEGDALNVSLLVPVSMRASRVGLVDALSAHYGSPGRLTDYRLQFERTTLTSGGDPSIFATTLETLAIKAFGDMGQTARLSIIRDRFIAGHSSCELRRHLDSVSPETPIWDIVDRCQAWESNVDLDVRRASKPGPDPTCPTYAVSVSDGGMDDLRVAAITTPQSALVQLETLFRRLLAGTAAPAPKPEPHMVGQLLQCLLSEAQSRQPVPAAATRISSTTRPQDLGGGAAQITALRDEATAWPRVWLRLQVVSEHQETVGVSAVLV